MTKLLLFPILGLIRIYQWMVSPWMTPGCRFLPTCSQYAYEAFDQHGFVRGVSLTFKRVFKCHPWGGSGYDPVPKKHKSS